MGEIVLDIHGNLYIVYGKNYRILKAIRIKCNKVKKKSVGHKRVIDC
jgi:hypothetical protein